jgi:hypothetical protein
MSHLNKRSREGAKSVHEKLGTAGLIVACIALVFAMLGGAYAATASKQHSKKAKAGKRGPRGPKGATGAQGPIGAVGPQGPKGDPGAKGDKGDPGEKGDTGEQGIAGEDGKSPVRTKIEPTEEGCEENGGYLYEVEGSGEEPAEVCNGKEGSPWTAGGTLPAGANETGTWYVEGRGGAKGRTAISFPIHVSGSVDPTNIHIFGQAGFSTFCGGAVYRPAAIAPGALCIFTGTTEAAEELKVLSNETEAGEFSQSGAIIQMKLGSEAEPNRLGFASGSFAISGG